MPENGYFIPMNSILRASVRFLSALAVAAASAQAGKILIPMDLSQTDHLKAYGIAYMSVAGGHPVEWLLNYRGGSFLMDDLVSIKREAAKRGVLFESPGEAEIDRMYVEIESANMDKVLLEKAPRIAVYTPLTKQPWDDAVTLAMSYSEIPYTKIYDKEIVEGKLSQYDWLHLHHEDFTGQHSKFFSSFRTAPWYVNNVAASEKLSAELGFENNVVLKKAVVLGIRDYVEKGGFLFAMCLACNTLDMALASVKTDAVSEIYDGTPPSPNLAKELDYGLSLAFTGFTVDPDPMSSSHGSIDYNQVNAGPLKRKPANDFILFDFSPKYDPVPSMLCQNHTDLIKGFFGLTTSFPKGLIKKSITILGQANGQEAVRYLHGNLGQGQFTYYGGHDPEDYSHAVGDSPTDLSLHKNSPGYRLILNNVLYPAARQKKRKT